MYGDNMRTLSEVNRDINECKALMNSTDNPKRYFHYKGLLCVLENEKKTIWNTLFEGHKNMVI